MLCTSLSFSSIPSRRVHSFSWAVVYHTRAAPLVTLDFITIMNRKTVNTSCCFACITVCVHVCARVCTRVHACSNEVARQLHNEITNTYLKFLPQNKEKNNKKTDVCVV